MTGMTVKRPRGGLAGRAEFPITNLKGFQIFTSRRTPVTPHPWHEVASPASMKNHNKYILDTVVKTTTPMKI